MTVLDVPVSIDAMISVVPVLIRDGVTRPLLFTVAIDWSFVVQVARDVKTCTMVGVLLDNNAVAANWCAAPPIGMNGAFGFTVMEIGSTTVSAAVPEMLLAVSVAVMVITLIVPLEPLTSEVARPLEPKLLLIVTAPAFDVLQSAAVVQSSIVPFENVAMAVNWCLVPVAMVGSAGDTVIEVSVPPLLPQLMRPIAAANSAARIIVLYFKIFIILFSPA